MDSENNIAEFFLQCQYVSDISELFRNLAKKHDLTYPLQPLTLCINIKTGINQLSPDSCCEVIYKINCQDCETSYVDQTKRSLKIRVKDHFMDIKKIFRFLVDIIRSSINIEL